MSRSAQTSKTLRVLLVILPVVVVATIIVVALGWTPPSYSQGTGRSQLSPTTTPVTYTISISATDVLSNGVITVVIEPPSSADIETYERVATTAIGASKDVLDIVKWLIGSIVAFVGAATSVLIAFFTLIFNRAQEASEAAIKSKTDADNAAKSAEAAVGEVKLVRERTEVLRDSIQTSIGQMEQAQKQFESMMSALERRQQAFETEVSVRLERLDEELQKRRRLADQDLADLKKSLTMFQLDEYGMATFSEDAQRRRAAIEAILEISRREGESAVSRRKCARVLGAMPVYD